MADSWRPSCSLGVLRARAELMETVRGFFRERDVLEVQTPTLAACTVTDVHVESIQVPAIGYLQTSPEYHLKRLLAAGAPSLFQIGPAYRAGERGRLHNPEFTLLEWYRLGFDDAALRAEVTELLDRVLGPAPVREVTYRDLLGDAAGLGDPDERDLAFSRAVEALTGRWFVTRYPADQAALARLCADDPDSAARFELVVDGVELANGYFELTDAAVQRRRFEADLAVRRQRGRPEPVIDEQLLAALQAGLPDCSGVALGVDRLLMVALGARSLADVMPFPAERA